MGSEAPITVNQEEGTAAIEEDLTHCPGLCRSHVSEKLDSIFLSESQVIFKVGVETVGLRAGLR
jgi:hypothetical protein